MPVAVPERLERATHLRSGGVVLRPRIRPHRIHRVEVDVDARAARPAFRRVARAIQPPFDQLQEAVEVRRLAPLSADRLVGIEHAVVGTLALLGNLRDRLVRGIPVRDDDQLAGRVVGAGLDLPCDVAAEHRLLAETVAEVVDAVPHGRIELRDGVELSGLRPRPRPLRPFDRQERLERALREALDADLEAVAAERQPVRIAGDEAVARQRWFSAHRVEEIGRQREVQHLLEHHAADDLRRYDVRGVLDRDPRREIRRDRRVLDGQRCLQVLLQRLDRPAHRRSLSIASAARSESAAAVSVGLAVPIVTWLPAPTT